MIFAFLYIVLLINKKIELKILYNIIQYKEIKMERRLNNKVESYIIKFKDNVKEKATQIGIMDDFKIITIMISNILILLIFLKILI
jgi:hypothetical protein